MNSFWMNVTGCELVVNNHRNEFFLGECNSLIPFHFMLSLQLLTDAIDDKNKRHFP